MGIELLFPFLASLFVMLGLRHMDQSNSQTGQIRLYAQKLMEELHQTALAKAQILKDARIDLEVLIKQSRKQNEETSELLGHVKSYWEDLKTGREELDRLQHEIQWMSKTAENLQKQKKELESGVTYLQNHKDEIHSISNDLDLLREEAESVLIAFQEKLNYRSDEILTSLSGKLGELEKLMMAKTDSIDKSIDDFSSYSKEKLETIAENLIEETLERAERGKKELQTFLNSFKTLEEEVDHKTQKFEDLAITLSEKTDQFERQLEERADLTFQSLESKLSRTEKDIHNKLKEYYSTLEESKSKTESDLDFFMKDLRSETRKTFEDEVFRVHTEKSTEILNTIQEAETKAQELQKLISIKLQETDLYLEEWKQAFHKSADQAFDHLESKSELLYEESKERNKDLENAITQNWIVFQKSKEELEAEWTNLRDKATSELKNKAEAFLSLQEEQLKNLNGIMDEKISSQVLGYFDTGKTTISDLETKIKNHITDQRKQLENLLKESKQNSKLMLSEFQSGLQEEITGVEDSYKLMIQNAETEIEKTKETLDQWKSEVDQLLKDSMDSKKFDLSEMDNRIRSLSERWSNFQIEIEPTLNKTQDLIELKNEVVSSMEALRNEKINIEETLKSISQIDEKKDELAEIQSMFDSRKQEMQSVLEEISFLESEIQNSKSIQSQIGDKLISMERELLKIESREEDLQTSLQDKESRIESLSSYEKSFIDADAKFEKIEGLLLDLSEKHKQVVQLQKRMDEIKGSSQEIKDDLESLLGEADQTFERLSGFLDVVQNQTYAINHSESRKKSSSSDSLIQRKKNTILSLYHNYNWPPDAISEKLNIEKSLVDSILAEKRNV
jgi:chromosome segregation ATPase